MNARWIASLLLLGGVATAGTATEDLNFAQRLSARGLNGMAEKVLDEMVGSRDPEKQRAGRYGKALVTKQEAQFAALRYVLALEARTEPPFTRERVIELYESAIPSIQQFVKAQGPGSDSAFLLADTLQEFAEFLVGGSYPDHMAEKKEELVDANKDQAEKLFEQAIQLYRDVIKALEKKNNGEVGLDSDDYGAATNAEYQMCIAQFRLALIYPSSARARFNARAGDAEEVLDEFVAKHYDELIGAFALQKMGELKYHVAVRTGDEDAGQVALDYLESVITQVDEDPTVPGTIRIIGEALYWYGKTANALGRADGKLRKPNAARFGDTIRMGRQLKQRVRYGAKTRPALLAELEVADALAAQGNYEPAVSIAGEVLTKARSAGETSVVGTATDKLTNWVANVSGAGALPPDLMSQIGDSLAAQGLTAKAVTFYEKAVSASNTPEEIEEIANDAWRKIAAAYRRDKRYIAAGNIAWRVVQDFQKSGQGEDSAFYQTASEACWQAVQAFKVVSESTKRSGDKAKYDEVLKTFRDRFPDHPQNADSAFSEALDLYTKEQYEEAAKRFKAITSSSPSYWSAQLRVPVCYRRLAVEKDKENAQKWHEATLKAAQDLYALASKRSDVPQAKSAARTALLMQAGAEHSLKQWEAALKSRDRVFAAYPGVFPKKGFEYKMKIDAQLALGQLKEAEATLAEFKSKLKGSSFLRRTNFDVYKALRDKYKPLGGRERAQMAGRAAQLYEHRIDSSDKPGATDFWFLADVLADAERYSDAGTAYAEAAKLASKPGQRDAWTLLAAEMKYKDARLNKTKMDPRTYRKIIGETRDLFTQVLLPDAKQREELLPILADGSKWPSKKRWRWLAGKPGPLLTAAAVYGEKGAPSPKGLDGRWIAVRLIDRLHQLTEARPEEGSKKARFVNLWWDGAQLQLELYLRIAEQGSSAAHSKKAAQYGFSFSRRIISQYPSMDGPERVADIKRLSKQLEARK
ncbi:MAG: hypothetical protein AAGD14_02915 [Planctomycetota bacterium]